MEGHRAARDGRSGLLWRALPVCALLALGVLLTCGLNPWGRLRLGFSSCRDAAVHAPPPQPFFLPNTSRSFPVIRTPTCPAEWANAYFLHIPKTAGSFVDNVMRVGLGSCGSSRGVGNWCHRFTLPQLVYEGCFPAEVEGRAHLAAQAIRAVYPSACNYMGSHQDITLYDAVLTPEQQRSTLLLTVLREPVDRAVSNYYFMRKYNILPPEYLNETDHQGLLTFVERESSNRMALQLAGDFGCNFANASSVPSAAQVLREEPERVLERARASLRRFCAVLVQERMRESVDWLKAVAGWTQFAVDVNEEVNANAHSEVPQHVLGRIREMLSLDIQVYQYGLELFEEQMRLLAAAARGKGGAGAGADAGAVAARAA